MPSRRELLRTGAAATALTALAGCADLMGAVGEPQPPAELAAVPDGAGAAVRLDAEAVRTDDGTRQLVNAWLDGRAEREYADDQPEDFEALLDRFEEDFGLDPTAVSSVTAFFTVTGFYGFGGRGYGAVVEADWAADDIADSLRASSGNDYEEDEHYGQPLYQPATDRYYSFGVWLGVLGEGSYVVGSEGAVRDAIEASSGEAESLDGRLGEAYAATRDAPVRFVVDPPLGLVPDEIDGADGTVPLEPLNEVATVAGAVYRDGDTRGIEVTMAADDVSTAENLVDTVDGYTAFAESRIEREPLATALDDVSVSRDGSDVVLTYEAPVDDLAETVRTLAGPSEDDGSTRRRETPTAAFSFDYDGTADTLEVTHDGGDSIRVAELYLRGDGFADAAGADMTDDGQWRGSASGEIDGEPAVVAGDRVVVGAGSAYDVRVVWRAEGGDQSATLAADEGPDA